MGLKLLKVENGEKPPYLTIKIWRKTHPKIKLLAALTGKSTLDLIEWLVTEELNRAGVKPSK